MGALAAPATLGEVQQLILAGRRGEAADLCGRWSPTRVARSTR